jgi:hypothetical protein
LRFTSGRGMWPIESSIETPWRMRRPIFRHAIGSAARPDATRAGPALLAASAAKPEGSEDEACARSRVSGFWPDGGDGHHASARATPEAKGTRAKPAISIARWRERTVGSVGCDVAGVTRGSSSEIRVVSRRHAQEAPRAGVSLPQVRAPAIIARHAVRSPGARNQDVVSLVRGDLLHSAVLR